MKKRSVSTYGKETTIFENKLKNFTKSKYAFCVINGTSGLHLSLFSLGVDNNCEVLIPALNYIASANAVIYCGGSPHFIDVEENTLGPDAEILDRNDKVPGKWRTCEVKVPKGRHHYTIEIPDKDKVILTRFILY